MRENFEDTIDHHVGKIRDAFPVPPALTDDPTDAEIEARYDGYANCTPKTALVLAVYLEMMADEIIDQCEHDEELDRFTNPDLPRVAANRTYEWMVRLSNCFMDLRDDIVIRGTDPFPKCTGEEVALWLAIRYAEDDLPHGLFSVREGDYPEADGKYADALESLPSHRHDLSWESLRCTLFEDHDFRLLYDMSLDGIESDDNEESQQFGCANLHPRDWFKWFRKEMSREPRDSHRAYRAGEFDHMLVRLKNYDENSSNAAGLMRDGSLYACDMMEMMANTIKDLPDGKQEVYIPIAAELIADTFVIGMTREDRVAWVTDSLSNGHGVTCTDSDGVKMYWYDEDYGEDE